MVDRAEVARHKLEVMRAWRRCLLDERGNPTDDGLIVMRDLEGAAFQLKSTATVATDGHIDTTQMAINEGKRSLYHFIRRRLFEPLEPLVKATEVMTDE